MEKYKQLKQKIFIIITVVLLITIASIFIPKRIMSNNTAISNGIVVLINGESYGLKEEVILPLSKLLQDGNCRIALFSDSYFANDNTSVLHMLLSNEEILILTLNDGMIRIQKGNHRLIYINKSNDLYIKIKELIS